MVGWVIPQSSIVNNLPGPMDSHQLNIPPMVGSPGSPNYCGADLLRSLPLGIEVDNFLRLKWENFTMKTVNYHGGKNQRLTMVNY